MFAALTTSADTVTATATASTAAEDELPGSLHGETPTRQRKKRLTTRSRLGCLTCRKRRKRCDEAKPDCSTCVRLNMTCVWAQANTTSRASSSSLAPVSNAHSTDTMEDFVNIFGDLSDSSHILRGPESIPAVAADDWEVHEATLQSWAAECLNLVSGQALAPERAQTAVVQADLTQSRGSRPATPLRPSSTSASHARLLRHFHDSLGKVLSCAGDVQSSAFEAFSQLANANAGGGVAARGLHLSILAWTGRHLANGGRAEYEAVCERLGAQSHGIVMNLLREARVSENESDGDLTLLAAGLMVMQFKICRGDVWGYEALVEHLAHLTTKLYSESSEDSTSASAIRLHFLENLVYHDILGSFILTRGPMVPYSVLAALRDEAPEILHTLTGLSLPLFIKMHRIAGLIRSRREHANGEWTDETLVDLGLAVEKIENELRMDKLEMEALIRSKPELAPHRYLHEAFRVACLMQLKTSVLGEPASSLGIRLLVRQALSLLEAMCDHDMPGYCSTHWVLFVTGVCAARSGRTRGELEDRERVERLYDDFYDDFPFVNVQRSRKLVHEVWTRNVGAQEPLDWIDIVVEYDWEIFLV